MSANDPGRPHSSIEPGAWLAVLLYALGVLAVFMPYYLLDGIRIGGFQLRIGKYSDLAAFLSGVSGFFLSLATFILVYRTYRSQRVEINESRKLELRQRIEDIFFRLLDAHRQNLHEIEEGQYSKRRVFALIREEFKRVHDAVMEELSAVPEGELPYWKRVELAFLLVYYGAGPISSRYHERIFSPEERRIIDPVLRHHEQANVLNGHQTQLAHYMDHFFNTIKYIDKKEDMLAPGEHADYVRLLASQLSPHELAIIALFSITRAAGEWQHTDLLIRNGFLRRLPPGTMHYLRWNTILPGAEIKWSLT